MKSTADMLKAKKRQDLVNAGAYDGRFKSKVVPSKKAYKRKERSHKDWE